MKRLAIIPIALVPAFAAAQSFNVDFNAAGGAGAGAPSAAFKGAAGQAGFWNAVGSQTTFTLAELDSAASAVTLTRTGGGTISNNSSAALAGDDEKLLEDAFTSNSGVTISYTFNNLQAGTYALYTYAIDPASNLTATVNVAGSTSRTNQIVGSFLSGPNYFVGATHALHVVTVGAGGNIAATIAPTSNSVDIAGFQLVRLSGTLLRMYVEDTAAGAHTGSSWADAFTNPQTALSAAWSAGGQNCEIWVANGFYKPTAGTDRFASFDIPSHLKFYGGFAGNENQLSQRGTNNLCYLNGEIGNAGLDTDNCYVVVNADFTAADTLIDGFRIHNGYNNEGSIGGSRGGGMRLQAGSATIRNCTFVGNFASSSGGGLYSDQGSPTLVDCLFFNDESNFDGGAVYHSGNGTIRMYNCEFRSNSSGEGNVHLEGGDALLVNCYFHGNSVAGMGGAIDADGAGSVVDVINCTVVGNHASQVTGGIYARNSATVTVRNSILWQNTSGFPIPTSASQYNSASGGSCTIAATTAEGVAGNPGLDPLFIDANGPDNVWGNFDDNCRLQPNSPCIDLSSQAALPADVADIDQDGNVAEQIPVDFDGLTRTRNVVVDRGAFEYQPPCNLDGDLDQDGDVDLTDLATLLGHFGVQNGGTAAHGDTDGDGDIDLTDLAALLSSFGQTCP